MKLLNAHVAVADPRKLYEYCLSAAHTRGRHKARVFASALGLSAVDAPRLRAFLLEAAASRDTVSGEADAFGQRYIIDAPWPGTSVTVRSLWMVRTGEDFPRLTSCYVL